MPGIAFSCIVVEEKLPELQILKQTPGKIFSSQRPNPICIALFTMHRPGGVRCRCGIHVVNEWVSLFPTLSNRRFPKSYSSIKGGIRPSEKINQAVTRK